MEIGDKYVDDMIRAVRRSKRQGVIDEISDLILEARADMVSAGISKTRTEDETDSLIKGAVRSFCRWKFGLAAEDAEANRRDYLVQIDNLRRREGYREEE